MIKQLDELSPNQRYHLMTQSIIPRPIAWVLTKNHDSSLNIAPFSYFSAVSSAPPLLMISIGKKPDGSDKDTRANIINNKEFVVHIANRSQAEEVNQSSATMAYGDSEVTALNLSTVAFEGFSVPRLESAPVAYACTLFRAENITPVQTMILGEVKSVYLADDIASESDGRLKVDSTGINPLSKLGGAEFGTLGDVIQLTRPK